MKTLMSYIKRLRQNYNKKEKFLIGTFASFLLLLIMAVISNFHTGNMHIVYVESIFTILTLFGFIYYLYSKNFLFGSHVLIIVTTIVTYLLLVEDGYRLSLFHVIVPLNYFFLFTLKRALLYTTIHQINVILIYLYGYYHYDGLPDILYHGNILSLVLASLVIVFFGVVYYMSMEKSYQQLEQSNYQKELLLSEIHHRVKNNLQMVTSILGLHLMGEKENESRQALQKCTLRLKSISLVHEILYKRKDFKELSFYNYIQNLIDVILELYDSDIELSIDGNYIYLPTDDILEFGIITNELLINTIKHAEFEAKGKVKITFEQNDSHYIYHYQDNGKNRVDPQNFIQEDSLGLKLIDLTVKQMHAELNISTDSGLSFEIRKSF